MTNLSRLIALTLLCAATCMISGRASAYTKTATLVVGNSGALTSGDTALKNRLNIYYTVTVTDDSAAARSDDLTVIAPSVAAATLGTKYKCTSKGVVVVNTGQLGSLYMGMASGAGTVSASSIYVKDATKQVAASLAVGVRTMYSASGTVGWGTPINGGVTVATTTSTEASRATIFTIDTDIAIAGCPAHGRRVGWFGLSSEKLTGGKKGGRIVFDFAADWADGAKSALNQSSPGGGLTWDATVTRYAKGCGDHAMTWTPDGNISEFWGDCNGLQVTSVKRSTGFSRVLGAATSPTFLDTDSGQVGNWNDIDIPGTGLDSTGDGKTGKKPASMLYADNVLYAFVRNIESSTGKGSRIKYSTNYTAANPTFTWASWGFPQFGYPMFINYGKNYSCNGKTNCDTNFVYVLVPDSNSAYVPGNRIVLLRAPVSGLLTRANWTCRTSTSWAAFADTGWPGNTTCASIMDYKGHALRGSVIFNHLRGKYYWWLSHAYNIDQFDVREFGGFGVYSAPNPWGPWTTVYYTEKWDIGPGEKGDFPTKWISGATGDVMYNVNSSLYQSNDWFTVRKATLGASH